jgi:aminoglycoside phosphotransferase family enzyme/predicted kinase
MPDSDLAAHARLVAALRRPAAWPAPVTDVRLMETHISSVLLAGDDVYKLKKPVALGFVDFSTVERRRAACEDEVRLNRRTAAKLYLGVVPITGALADPRIGGTGPVLDHAVHMRRFPDDALFDTMARAGRLTPALVDHLADVVADFHARLPAAAADAPWGTPSGIHRTATENVAALLAGDLAPDLRARVRILADWTDEEFDRRSHQLAARRHHGFVRECHGDLHLRNVALVDGAPMPFDCLEFDAGLRWIDTMNELAFTFMDLLDHDLPRLAWRFLDRMLVRSGDFAGLATLRFYAVYRALVRGKVALIRAAEPDVTDADRAAAHASFARHLALAERIAAPRPALVVLMHGLSGSGKSTVARAIAEQLGAVRVASDVERKRLHRLAAEAGSGSAQDAGIYDASANRATYERLAECMRAVVDAGWPAIVDAAFLRAADRRLLIDAARDVGARIAIVDCRAPVDVLRDRVQRRAAAGNDPSEATLAVLEAQRSADEPFEPAVAARVVAIDTDATPAEVDARAGALAQRLAAPGATA